MSKARSSTYGKRTAVPSDAKDEDDQLSANEKNSSKPEAAKKKKNDKSAAKAAAVSAEDPDDPIEDVSVARGAEEDFVPLQPPTPPELRPEGADAHDRAVQQVVEELVRTSEDVLDVKMNVQSLMDMRLRGVAIAHERLKTDLDKLTGRIDEMREQMDAMFSRVDGMLVLRGFYHSKSPSASVMPSVSELRRCLLYLPLRRSVLTALGKRSSTAHGWEHSKSCVESQ